MCSRGIKTHIHTHAQKKMAALAFPRLANMKLISGGAVSDDLKVAALFCFPEFWLRGEQPAAGISDSFIDYFPVLRQRLNADTLLGTWNATK